MRLLWINEDGFAKGGAERYVRDTALLLRERGIRSSLFYDVRSRVDRQYASAFDGVFPIVDVERQLKDLAPDVVYVHRIEEGAHIEALARAAQATPVVRFYHDHKLFCLREHKYTAITQQTCTRAVGLGCYPCLGFVQKTGSAPNIGVVSVGSLLRKQRANQRLSAFVVGSHYMADQVAAHGFDRHRIHVLPLYTAAPDDMAPVTRARDRLLFVGQMLRGKGVDILLRAVARTVRPVHVDVLGRGKQEDEFRQLAKQLGIADRVTFVGSVPASELSRYYASARALVFPSRSPETFGLAGLEAMALGLPVIASDVGGVREWLEDGRNGIAVRSGDVDAFARAMDQIVRDDAFAAALGARARETHRERFLPEHHIDKLEPLLRGLVSRRAA